MNRRTFLAMMGGATYLAWSSVVRAASVCPSPIPDFLPVQAIRSLAVEDGWHADYLTSLWGIGAQCPIGVRLSVSSISDMLGRLPDLLSSGGKGPHFDPSSFGGRSGLRGGPGLALETAPFNSIQSPYFVLFAVDMDVSPSSINPVLLDGSRGRPRDLTVFFGNNPNTPEPYKMWNANAGGTNQFANDLGSPMVVGLLINGIHGAIWVNGVKTVADIDFGSNGLTSLRFLNHNSLDQPFEGSATPPLIYKGIPSDAVVDRMMAAVMEATQIHHPATSFQLLGRSNPLPCERLQGVAYDGTHYYVCDSWTIYKMTRVGDTYTVVGSVDTRNHSPVGKKQINGLDVRGGYLWVGANNFNTEPRRGWVAQYDLANLSFVAVHTLDNHWNEGGAWKDVGNGDEYWAIYHDWPRVARYALSNNSLVKVADYLLPLVEGRTESDGQRGLYQGAQWMGDVLITQTHLANGTPMTHFHRWNGNGFEVVRESFAFTHNLGQGLHWEVEGDVMLFACRSAGGPQTIVRAAYINS